MAVLTTNDLAGVRGQVARRVAVVTWTKAQVNAAVQAIEDAVQATSNVGNRTLKAYIAAAIETAAPTVFGAAQKDELFLLWTQLNARRGGLL